MDAYGHLFSTKLNLLARRKVLVNLYF